MFHLKSPYQLDWDQPRAVKEIINTFNKWKDKVVLLGATWTGKTFTIANIINELKLPTLVLSHNKTLAAQLTTEFKGFFPDNSVHYFVSYFDYYQPESYVPASDMYIEKDSAVNKDIEMYRLAAMSSLITNPDTIIISSVSAIYGLGSKQDFEKFKLDFKVWNNYNFKEIKEKLLAMQYKPMKGDLVAGTFDFRWNILDVFSSIENMLYRIIFDENTIEYIEKKDPITWKSGWTIDNIIIWSATQFVQSLDDLDKILKKIKEDLDIQVEYFKKRWELLFAERIKQRVEYDMKMIKETGFTGGIENYSRYFDWRKIWEPTETIFDYFPEEFLLIIDESHMTIPQFQAMPQADASRKKNLVNYGFRLPSSKDHRPLNWLEFEYLLNFKKIIAKNDIWTAYLKKSKRKKKKVNVMFVSATPGKYELKLVDIDIVEQIIRPTWLLDPNSYIYPKSGDYDFVSKSFDKALKKVYEK